MENYSRSPDFKWIFQDLGKRYSMVDKLNTVKPVLSIPHIKRAVSMKQTPTFQNFQHLLTIFTEIEPVFIGPLY